MVINLIGILLDGDVFDFVKIIVFFIVILFGNILECCLEYFLLEFYIYYKFNNIN